VKVISIRVTRWKNLNLLTSSHLCRITTFSFPHRSRQAQRNLWMVQWTLKRFASNLHMRIFKSFQNSPWNNLNNLKTLTEKNSRNLLQSPPSHQNVISLCSSFLLLTTALCSHLPSHCSWILDFKNSVDHWEENKTLDWRGACSSHPSSEALSWRNFTEVISSPALSFREMVKTDIPFFFFFFQMGKSCGAYQRP